MGLLAELGRRLAAEGIHADVHLVGGVAVMLSGSRRRTTRDVDASYAPKEAVEQVAAAMAKDLDLPEDWLNDRARAFIPDGVRWVAVDVGWENAGLKLGRADDESLLAMKMAAERDSDIPDIAFLSSKLEVDDAAEIVAVAYRIYGEDSIPLSGDPDDYLIVAEEALAKARLPEARPPSA
nr:DUF6036 family nucleotidyltransferase [Arthrobacter gengyunqii]